jgi:hypothetical protein
VTQLRALEKLLKKKLNEMVEAEEKITQFDFYFNFDPVWDMC